MNETLSFWYMISNATFIVQMVMLILFSASCVSWAMIIQRYMYFRAARQAADQFEEDFWSGMDLSQLYKRSTGPDEMSGTEAIFRAGYKEYSRLRQQQGVEADAVMEGAQRAMRVAMAREEEKLDKHLAFLATVGSTSPYVGLFGTVWGIMNSFRGLANMKQATIATVAPGISEALVATAIGLFAAIPAVIAFNRFASRSDSLLKSYQTFSDEFSSILHRQAHSKRRSGE